MGILANSVSVTHASSTSDDTNSGYVLGERITLTLSVAATAYTWGIAKPANASARSDLSDTDVASPSFEPDVGGYYVVTCLATVGGTPTLYILRIAASAPAVLVFAEAVDFAPLADSQVATPAQGVRLYYSSTQGAWVVRNAAGETRAVTLGSPL